MQRKLLRRGEERGWGEQNPCACGRPLARAARAPAVQVVERLDNGAMVRPVERPVDIVQQVRDHNKKAEER